MNRPNCLDLAAAALFAVAGAATAAAPAPAPATTADNGYTALVDAVVARYQLPGIAVGVIDHGKVVYTHTAGQNLTGQPINDDTIFKLGSVSKAFTVTLLARLAQQGKLKWDAPVTQYLPAFAMHDPWVTQHMQVFDLVAHHSGLAPFSGDLMLWPHPSRFTPDDVVKAMRYLTPSYSFRGGYSYDNVLFVVAGQVAAAAGGEPYADLMRREVFQPLGLTRCEVGTWNRAEVGNVAQPHSWHDGKFVAEGDHGDVSQATTMAAAGGVQCSLTDMLTWARNWLTPTPQQLDWLNAAERASEWQPYTVRPVSKQKRDWNDPTFVANAHGWFVSDPDGRIAVWHTGVLGGIRAALVLLPYQKSGFVILLNSGSDDALDVLQEVLLKRLVAPGTARPVAWYADYLARAHKAEQKPVPNTAGRVPATASELTADLGVWRSPWFGDVRICSAATGVTFASEKSPLLTGQVMRFKGKYLVHWDEAPDAWLEFPAQAGGAMHMALVDANADASSDFRDLAFTRVGGCQ